MTTVDKEGNFKHETEEEYNKRTAKLLEFVCLDRKMVKSVGRTAIEFCDLFGKSRTKVHVKKGATSSALSHLFQQGVVSAELLADDHVFRNGVREVLEGEAPIYKKLIPEDRPKTHEFEIVFAIIDNRDPKEWPKSLPFFSQVTLRNCHKHLTGMGYKVSIRKIGIADPAPPKAKIVVRKKAS